MGSSGQGAMERPSTTASQTMAWGSFLAPCTRCSAEGRTARGGKRLVPKLRRFLRHHVSRYFRQAVRLARERAKRYPAGTRRERKWLILRSEQSHGGIIFCELFHFARLQLRRDSPHTVEDIVMALPARKSIKLCEQIFLPLSGQRRGFDWASRMRAVTGRTARDPPCGIPILDEAYDIGIAGGDGARIESPLGQSGKMRRDIGHLVVIKVLNDGGHDITDAGTILEVMQLLIDREGRLP